MQCIHYITSLPVDGIDVSERVTDYGFGLYETMGARPSQEDAAFACWYAPNHFNSLTPQDIGRRLWTSYHLINILGRNVMYGGTTASTTVYDGHGTLITATLADSLSFAVIYNVWDKLAGVVRLNSIIHHPEVELERIQRAGGVVFFDRINGQLAVSRALGDFDFNAEVVCADAHIDVNPLDKIHSSLGISPEQVGTMQIITTCDGFTEPLAFQTQKEQEQWLFNCLNEIPLANKLEEHQLAKMLVNKALEEGSRDNISIAIQTLSTSRPFLIGIYDGHGGKGASQFTAKNIGSVFDYQCSLTQEAYVQQSLSAEKNFITYYRDNKDWQWYESLAEAVQLEREAELSKSAGIRAQMHLLRVKTKEYLATMEARNNESSALLSAEVQNFYECINTLCNRYVDLTLSKDELQECVNYILNSSMSRFEWTKYSFLSLNFKECRNNAETIKRNYLLKPVLARLTTAFASIFHVS
ncbi:PP2C family serine/threonine-protein phosphatase [Legionella sp. WA2024007413]